MFKEVFVHMAIGNADLFREEWAAEPDAEDADDILRKANAFEDAIDILEGINDVKEADAVSSAIFDGYMKGSEVFLAKVEFFKRLYLH
jgi:hypothetical protein